MPLLFAFVIAVLVNFSSPVSAQDTSTQIRGPRSSDAPAMPQSIGPLSPQDTLWRVAERVRPDPSLSLYQVMYALYLKNPDAFLDNNLNHLRPGAVLLLPSLREMQQVDLAQAKQKSEQDDNSWAQRQKTASTPAAETKSTAKLTQELAQIRKQQQEDLERQLGQFADSMQQVEAIAEENRQLKTSLTKLEAELQLIKEQLGEDSQLQQQISQLLAQQAELLQAKAEQEAQAEAGIDWQQWLKNPLAWVLAACIPALAVLLSILLWIKKRNKQSEQVIQAATSEPVADPTYQSPLPPLEDSTELDESLFEIDDSLLEDAFSDSMPTANDGLSDDLLELDDTLSFEDDSLLPSDAADDSLSIDSTDAFDPDNILSDTDLSALLAAEDDDDFIELADDADAAGDLADADDALPDPDDVLAEFDDALPDLTDTLPEPDDSLAEFEPADSQTAMDEIVDADDIDALLAQNVADDDIDPDALLEQYSADTLADEIDVDELIEEIDLDALGDTDNDAEAVAASLQEQQLTQALQAQLQPMAPAPDSSSDVELETLTSDVDELESTVFDSSELEEFAESLVDEPQPETDAMANDEESLLSAELAELLDQVAEVTTVPGNAITDDTSDASLEQTAAEDMAAIGTTTDVELIDALKTADDNVAGDSLNGDSLDADNELLQPNALPEAELQAEATAPDLSEIQDLVSLEDDDVLLDDSPDDVAQGLSAPELTAADDGSVARISEAALSVENPSKMLEQYPELALDEALTVADSPEAETDAELVELDTDLLLQELDALTEVDDFSELTTDTELTTAADYTLDSTSDAGLTELDPMPDAQFDSLMSELEAMAENLQQADSEAPTLAETALPPEAEQQPVAIDGFDFTDDDFVEIDTLLANAELQDENPERFNQLNVDVGLEDYADIIGEHERRDVDKEDAGFSAKLDLVRAYIEIDDRESADLLLDDILASDAPEHVKAEAKTLK